MQNLEIVKQGYKYFSEGNIEAVLGVFDPDIVWEESTGFPYIEDDGIFRGHQAIVKNVFSNIPEYMDNFTIKVDQLIEAGDNVIMAGHYEGVWKETGKKFSANAAHVWTLKNGKATHFFQAVDTATIRGI